MTTKRKTFSKAFKEEAVSLLEAGKQPPAEIVRQLGINRNQLYKWQEQIYANPHFSPGSREQAQDSYSKAPLWSEKRSNSYGLSEEQAYGYEDQPES